MIERFRKLATNLKATVISSTTCATSKAPRFPAAARGSTVTKDEAEDKDDMKKGTVRSSLGDFPVLVRMKTEDEDDQRAMIRARKHRELLRKTGIRQGEARPVSFVGKHVVKPSARRAPGTLVAANSGGKRLLSRRAPAVGS